MTDLYEERDKALSTSLAGLAGMLQATVEAMEQVTEIMRKTLTAVEHAQEIVSQEIPVAYDREDAGVN